MIAESVGLELELLPPCVGPVAGSSSAGRRAQLKLSNCAHNTNRRSGTRIGYINGLDTARFRRRPTRCLAEPTEAKAARVSGNEGHTRTSRRRCTQAGPSLRVSVGFKRGSASHGIALEMGAFRSSSDRPEEVPFGLRPDRQASQIPQGREPAVPKWRRRDSCRHPRDMTYAETLRSLCASRSLAVFNLAPSPRARSARSGQSALRRTQSRA